MDIIYSNFHGFKTSCFVIATFLSFTAWRTLRSCVQSATLNPNRNSKQWTTRRCLRKVKHNFVITERFTGPWIWKKLCTLFQTLKATLHTQILRSLRWRLALWTNNLNESLRNYQDTAMVYIIPKNSLTWASSGTNFLNFTESNNLLCSTTGAWQKYFQLFCKKSGWNFRQGTLKDHFGGVFVRKTFNRLRYSWCHYAEKPEFSLAKSNLERS